MVALSRRSPSSRVQVPLREGRFRAGAGGAADRSRCGIPNSGVNPPPLSVPPPTPSHSNQWAYPKGPYRIPTSIFLAPPPPDPVDPNPFRYMGPPSPGRGQDAQTDSHSKKKGCRDGEVFYIGKCIAHSPCTPLQRKHEAMQVEATEQEGEAVALPKRQVPVGQRVKGRASGASASTSMGDTH